MAVKLPKGFFSFTPFDIGRIKTIDDARFILRRFYDDLQNLARYLNIEVNDIREDPGDLSVYLKKKGSGGLNVDTPTHDHSNDDNCGVIDFPDVITDHGELDGLEDDDHPQYLIYIGDAEDDDDVVDVANDGGIVSPGSDTQVPTEAAVVDWVQAVCVLNVQVGWFWALPSSCQARAGAIAYDDPFGVIDTDPTTYAGLGDAGTEDTLFLWIGPILANSVRIWAYGHAVSGPPMTGDVWKLKVEVWDGSSWTVVDDGVTTSHAKGQWIELGFTEKVISGIKITDPNTHSNWTAVCEVELHCFGLIHSTPPE